MKTINYIFAVIFCLLLAYCCYQIGLNSSGYTVTSDTLKVYHDTVYRESYSDKPYPVYRDTGSTEYVVLPVDTALIFQAYAALHHKHYTRNIYCDTLKNDTSAFVAIRDTVYKNELLNRQLIYQNRTPVYYITRTITETPKNKLFLGADVTGIAGKTGFDISLMYENKGMAYRYAYNPVVGEHSIGMYVLLWPRSRSPAKK